MTLAQRRLGATEYHTIPLVFGGNVFGWTADKQTSFALLDRFVAGGGTMIDTADVYSAWVDGHRGGESETIIGEFNRKFTLLDRYVLDLTRDPGITLDRRVALALGGMLDTGERR